jgi:hypothetical protein
MMSAPLYFISHSEQSEERFVIGRLSSNESLRLLCLLCFLCFYFTPALSLSTTEISR